jgi:SAM-dependent methyltransferase
MWGRLRERSREPELIDGVEYSQAEYLDCLADLRRVNRYLGGYRSLARHLFPRILRLATSRGSGPDTPVRLLDIGTGSADIPRTVVDWARRQGVPIQFVVVDLNHLAALEARSQVAEYPEIVVVRADAMALPFGDKAFDFVIASLFLHHFEDAAAARLISSFARVAGGEFIVNDLRRHPLAWLSIIVLTRLFTRNRLVRNDAVVSVERGFTALDLDRIAQMAGVGLKFVRHFPYRYIITGSEKR